MNKKLFTFGALTLAAVAAFALTVDGAVGRGVATNADGVNGSFDFHVRKITHEGQTRVLGGGKFGISNRDEHRRLAIVFHAARFASTEHTAEFGGPGIRIVWANGVRREVRGLVVVRVADNHREGSGDPDGYAISFNAEGTAHDFGFRGNVTRGALSVFHRSE